MSGQALPLSRLPAHWAGRWGPPPTCCERGCVGVGAQHCPLGLHALWGLRAVMVVGGRPRGGRRPPLSGASGVRRCPPPNRPSSGAGGRGSATRVSRVRSVRVWGPSTGPTARALAGRRCATGVWRKVPPGGGAVCRCGGRLGSDAPPSPGCPPSGRAAGAHYPLVVGAGGCRLGGRSPTQQRALLRAGFFALWGRHEGARGGAPPAWVWGVRGWALSQPRLPALWAGFWGPLPTGCRCGGLQAWGPVTNPTARTLACCGGGMRMPWGGASCLGSGRPGSGAPPPPTAPSLGGLPGPSTHWLWVRGGAGVGTRHQPHSACSCELALRALGAAQGRPGRAPPAWVWGVRGRVLSHPRLPALWAGCRGPLPTGCGSGGVRAWGPVTNPTARAAASWLCALWGRHEGARGGRLLPGCGASGVGRSPTPDCPPSRRAAGAHYPLAVGAGGCGRGDPSPTPQRALLRAGYARCGGGTRAPGGGASCLGVGRPGSGALPPPTARLLGGLPGATTHWLWVRGGAGVGTRHQPHSARSCVLWRRHEGARGGRPLPGCGASGVRRSPCPDCPPPGRAAGAHYPLAVGAEGGAGVGTHHQPHSACSCEHALRAVGAALGCPGGAPLTLVWDFRGRALSHPRLPVLRAGCWGPLPTDCGRGGVRGWGPVTNPTARALASWLCAQWGRHEGARGGRLLPGCRASGVGRSPNPDCPPSGRAAGAHYPLAVGVGGCGRGDPSPTPQRALLRAGFARCGGGTKAPGGGASFFFFYKHKAKVQESTSELRKGEPIIQK